MSREYRQVARQQQTDQRRQQIIWAVGSLIVKGSFDDMTLQAVAREAGVSLKTVTRHFGTREDLLRAAMQAAEVAEEAERSVSPGDVAGVVAVLADRYEGMAEMIYRMGDVELKYHWLSDWVQMARNSHLDWLAVAFAPWLPESGSERDRRLLCLFTATEVRSWWAVRHRFDQGREQAAAVMLEQLTALTSMWERIDLSRAGRAAT